MEQEMTAHKACDECGNTELLYEKVDVMGDGKEEHFGKTAVICADTKNCGKVVRYID